MDQYFYGDTRRNGNQNDYGGNDGYRNRYH